jgi:hypothetical protein
MKTQEVSIYNDSAREYLKWARTESDYTLIEQVRKCVAGKLKIEYVKGNKVEYSITDEFLLRRMRLMNKILRIRNSVRKLVSDCCATVNGSPYTDTKGWSLTHE